jgi:hypothetical protein
MEHQESAKLKALQGNPQPFEILAEPSQGGEPHQPKPPRKRDRSAKETPGFDGWVTAKNKVDFPSRPLVGKAIDVIALPAVAVGAGSKITVRIEKSYKVRVELTEGQTRVTGELHLVPWDKYKDVVEGLIAATAAILNLQPEKILKESDIPALANGTANPSFRLTIPRHITADEQLALDLAFLSFHQRIRGQDESLTKDMFAELNPDAVSAGQRAAEGVRRKAGGRSLPQLLTVTSVGSTAKPITLGGRIGNHPDPERDEDPVPISGKIVSIKTEERQFAIRSSDFMDKKGKRAKSAKGRKFMINYSDKEHRADVLKLPLGLNQVVDVTVTPRVGRNKDKLMLKSIDKVQPPAAAAVQSSTTP